MVESAAKLRALPYHKKKMVLVLSALHHFAEELREDGYTVEIIEAPTYVEGIKEHLTRQGSSKLVYAKPHEWGLMKALESAAEDDNFGVPVECLEDGGPRGHFLLERHEFEEWAADRKTLRMVDFYRFMRQRTGWLMKDGEPVGGKLSYDVENRSHARGRTPPDVPSFEPDDLTRKIMARVAEWSDHWGEVDGFDWPVTRRDALDQLDAFFSERSKDFGTYQDAMLSDEPFMWHGLISSSMNLGLLHPREVCERAVAEYEEGRMPLAAVEGFVRQIMGWREFIRGVYWLRVPQLREANLLSADRPLPAFFWEPDKTDMACLADSIGQVRETGYGHHIQRLMVQGNFALLAGISPRAISHWFWAGFIDAYEWVELPNVVGMAVFADDAFTTKPYAASGSYINKMSDYCSSCRYNVKKRTGPDACPFNPLFWSFMERHRERLEANPRLRMLYRTWDKFAGEERQAILETARGFLDDLEPETTGWKFDDDAG